MKLGYLAAEVIDGCLLVTSFIFITMSQTPEGQKLYNLLKLTMEESKYHKLHDIDTFITTDIFDDPLLSRALHASGCGDLEKVRNNASVSDKRAVAEELRKYMNLFGRREEKLSRHISFFESSLNPESESAA